MSYELDPRWIDGEEDSHARRLRRARRHRRAKRERMRRIRRRVLTTLALLCFLVALAFASWFQWTFGGLERMTPLAGQAGANSPGTTTLVVGYNSEEPDARPGPVTPARIFEASHLVMLLHLSADNEEMTVISIPGQTRVPWAGGRATLGNIHARDGAEAYVKAIEQLTGTRMDRVAALSLEAWRETTSLLESLQVVVPVAGCDRQPGATTLDAVAVLEYVTLQDCLPNGDLDRVARQQSLVKAFMHSAIDSGRLFNPLMLSRMLRASASNATIEEHFGWTEMAGQLWDMKGLRTSSTQFVTMPARIGPNGNITMRPQAAEKLWAALRADRLAEYVQLNLPR